MITEDLDGFLADFGVDATFNAETAKVIFDMPDTMVMNDAVITASYTITYKSSSFSGLAYGSSITVDGDAYTVNSVQKLDDGAFSRAELSKS